MKSRTAVSVLLLTLGLLSASASAAPEPDFDSDFEPNTYYAEPAVGTFYFDRDGNFVLVSPTAVKDPDAPLISCALKEILELDADTRCSPTGRGLSTGQQLRASCWQFNFSSLTSGTFPNPFNQNSPAKGRFDLLVLDTDFQFHPATLTYKVFNLSGQLVASGFLGSFNASPSFDVPIWNGGSVTSGFYFIRVTASTSLCGSRTHSYSNASWFLRSSVSCVSAPSGLRAWYPLDETSGTTANNLSGLVDGTHINGPAKVSGRVAGALDFDGSNDYVSVPDNSSIDFGTGDFSINAWIKTTDTSAVVAAKRSLSAGRYTGYIFMVFSGRLLLQIADTPSSWFNYVNLSSQNVADGNWHLVTVTVDRNSATGGKMYVDGNVVYTFDPRNRSGSISNASPLQIGRTSQGESYFDGTIDELQLFNRALSQSEIRSIHNAGAGGVCK